MSAATEALRKFPESQSKQNTYSSLEELYYKFRPTEKTSRFPTLEKQFHQCKLSNKQHLAFLLLGTDLLHYISTSQTNEDCVLTEAMRRLKSAIDQLVTETFPNSKQLVMFLGGSGGTGKSSVI